MPSPDWLTHDALQAMLKRQEAIQTTLERGEALPVSEALWLSHTCGKLLFAKVADVVRKADCRSSHEKAESA